MAEGPGGVETALSMAARKQNVKGGSGRELDLPGHTPVVCFF